MTRPANNCLSTEQILALSRGDADAALRAHIEEHIDTCALCRAQVAEGLRAPADQALTAAGSARGRRRAANSLPPVLAQMERYAITDEIGAGGMGVVYLADDLELRRKVVIKLLRPERIDPRDTSGARARLQREAQAMARVSHPNVVSVFDVGTVDAEVFIAMEYVEGGTLHDWVTARRRPARAVLEVCRAEGQGLAAAHRAHLVHRDFKPQNVLVSRDARVVKVTDFGLARAASHDAPHAEPRVGAEGVAPTAGLLGTALTETGMFLGTPAYMAPEQISGDPVDGRCDQFSFCVTVWEALFGVRPFSGKTPHELLSSIMAGQPREGHRGAEVPRNVRAALARGLAFEPEMRHESMLALLDSLRLPRWRGRALLVGAAASAAAAAGILSIGLAGRGDDPCAIGAQRMNALWNSERRNAVDRLVATMPAGGSVVDRLDDYADGWRRGYRDVCAATLGQREGGEAEAADQMACLEHRRASLAYLLTAVETAALAASDVVDRVAALPAVEACLAADTATEALRSAVPPELLAPIAELRGLMSRAGEALIRQDFQAARPLLDQVVSGADAVGFAPLSAESLLRLADLHRQLGQLGEAGTSLQRALEAAERSKVARLRAAAHVSLSQLSTTTGDLAEAERWLRVAQAGWDDPNDADMTGRIDIARAHLQLARGEHSPAIEALRHAAEVRRSRLSGQSPLLLEARIELANALASAGQPDAAIDLLDSAIADYGSESEQRQDLILEARSSRGVALLAAGRGDEAERTHKELLATGRSHFAARSPFVAREHYRLALALKALGRTAEATIQAKAAVELHTEIFGKENPDTGHAHALVGDLLTASGQLEDGRRSYWDALNALELSLGQGHPALIPIEMAKATNYLADEGLVYASFGFQTAARWARQVGPDLDQVQASAHLGDGIARLAEGRADEAVAVLETSLQLLSGEDDDARAAPVKLALARALWLSGGDRARAQELAESGLAGLAPEWSELRDQATLWSLGARSTAPPAGWPGPRGMILLKGD